MGDPETGKRLLAMLNAGKGAPTSPPSSASADISIGIERIATPTVLSPASASGPSGSRSASINDLFASLGAAQTTSAPPNASPGAASPSRDASPAPTVAPPSGAMDLLGLLKKAQSKAAKRAPSAAPAPSHTIPHVPSPPPTPSRTLPAAAHSPTPPSPPAADGPADASTAPDAPSATVAEAEDPFSNDHEVQVETVTSFGQAGPSGTEKSASGDEKVNSHAEEDSRVELDQGGNAAAKEVPSPAPPITGPATAPAPTKTIFDFVSPFDMFTKPKPSPKPPSAIFTPAQIKTKSKEVKAAVQPAPASAAQDTPATTGAEAATGQTSITSSGTITVEKAESTDTQSAVPSLVTSKPVFDIDETWNVTRVTGGQTGRGPSAAPSHIVIDLSQPNLDTLIPNKRAVQVEPTTVLKGPDVSFKKGRTMGMTAEWFAYGLSRGKLRLIDRATGSRLVLDLGGTAAGGQIIDMAVTPTLLAVVAADHSIIVYRLPQSWSKDDPVCERILHLHGSSSEIGKPFKVEWVGKTPDPQLAIGGDKGVVLVDPTLGVKQLEDVVRKHKLYITDGDLVDFCLNATHQALGLFSSSAIFSLYSVTTTARVWHRQFPSHLKKPGAPSSVFFCESNIMAGRDRNTHFDLIQIASELAVIGSVSFKAPPPCASDYHYTHAFYDQPRKIIWIAPFARGSLYGIRTRVKERGPFRVSQGEATDPWELVGEVQSAAMEPIMSFAQGITGEEEDLEVFYAHTKGFSMGRIQSSVLGEGEESMEMSVPSQKKQQEAVTVEQEQEVPSTPKPAQSSPVKVNEPPPAAPSVMKQDATVRAKPPAVSRKVSRANTVKSPTKTSAELVEVTSPQKPGGKAAVDPSVVADKNLKKTEDRIVTQTRQAISGATDKLGVKIDALDGKLAGEVVAKMEESLQGSIIEAVKEETHKSVTKIVQHELRAAIPAAIATSARQIFPAELEREMGSLLHHILPGAVQAAVDRSVNSSLQRILIPDVAKMMVKMSDEVMDNIREELLQVKKDMSPTPEPIPVDLTPVTEQLAEMQKQISFLTEQLTRQPPQPPALSTHPPPAETVIPPTVGQLPVPAQQLQSPTVQAAYPAQHPQYQQHAPLPQQRPVAYDITPPPNALDLEDAFLAALSQQTTSATVKLVRDYYRLISHCLPLPTEHAPARASPLSAAVKIALLHRLALAMADLSPMDPAFGTCLEWFERVVRLVEPQDAEIAAVFPRVKQMVIGLMDTVLQSMSRDRMGGTVMAHAVHRTVQELRQRS